jgi:hypothetical protein
MEVAKAAKEEKAAKPAKAMMMAWAAIMEKAAMSAKAMMGEKEATAWPMRAAQAKAVEVCREEERGLDTRFHSRCLSKVQAHSVA